MKTIADILGERIARDIFRSGDEGSKKTQRIQFKAGSWLSGTEISLGGLCEEALAKLISNSIKEHFCVVEIL